MSNQQDSSSKGLITIITTLIGVLGTVAVAYFAFRGNIEPRQLEIHATQTAESIRATQSAAAPMQVGSTSSITDIPVPPTTESPPILSSINWIVDPAGVCRDDKGNYPRWSEYNWSLQQCEEACQANPNCQGFTMSKQRNYCQLFGSDGNNEGSNPNAQITRGDKAQPDYACYLKSGNQSILAWTMDSTGACRDDAGNYPRWSEYNWTLSQCEEACQANPNCQGFAMSKQDNYCQLFGSDGNNEGSNPNAQITRGDSSQPQYTCYIRR